MTKATCYHRNMRFIVKNAVVITKNSLKSHNLITELYKKQDSYHHNSCP